MISENLALISHKIAAAVARAGRKPGEVRIVAAAKGQGREKIEEAAAGQAWGQHVEERLLDARPSRACRRAARRLETGRLQPGYWADLTVLELPQNIGPRNLLAQVLEGAGECIATVVQGQIAWCKPDISHSVL